ncbi:hypothetical protein [Hydrogenimonas cancrithermarum]|uniref:Uncharacterized protein n=1 Tax=Hydrogenimonas cancrithermarum TaxID=2993563 RepID=A0ABM8FN33_9BACT|nr:hypothetical protein [Hydrogenimonas cancrithermarum]BDY13784.1 hypothetical protein HCR_20960 [Hydrogenimonas cancrithermarum]
MKLPHEIVEEKAYLEHLYRKLQEKMDSKKGEEDYQNMLIEEMNTKIKTSVTILGKTYRYSMNYQVARILQSVFGVKIEDAPKAHRKWLNENIVKPMKNANFFLDNGVTKAIDTLLFKTIFEELHIKNLIVSNNLYLRSEALEKEAEILAKGLFQIKTAQAQFDKSVEEEKKKLNKHAKQLNEELDFLNKMDENLKADIAKFEKAKKDFKAYQEKHLKRLYDEYLKFYTEKQDQEKIDNLKNYFKNLGIKI